MFQNIRILTKQPDRQSDQVIEVNRIAPFQPFLVLCIDIRDLKQVPVAHGKGILTALCGTDQFILLVRDLRKEHFLLIQFRIDLQMSADILHQVPGIIRIVDVKVSLVSKPVYVLPQDPHAGRMEGRHMDRFRAESHHPVHSAAHLLGSFVGKCDRADVPRRHTFLPDQPCDPVCENSRLSRSRACKDQKRSVHMCCCLLLLRVQPL